MDNLRAMSQKHKFKIAKKNFLLNPIRKSFNVLQFPVLKLGNRSAKKSVHSFERSAKRVPLTFRFRVGSRSASKFVAMSGSGSATQKIKDC